jgi:hypothetical protein
MVLDKGLYDKIESIHNNLFEVNKIEISFLRKEEILKKINNSSIFKSDNSWNSQGSGFDLTLLNLEILKFNPNFDFYSFKTLSYIQ